jgi:NAD(P)-dependent dehydrogenase (short-subunit alcohol dehydrogenase family)
VTKLKGAGIRIDILSPGPTNTASLTAKSPLERFGEPGEIALTAAFLASDAPATSME